MANCSQDLGINHVRILAGLRGSISAVALLLTVGLLMITRHYAAAKGKKWFKVSLYVLFGSSISYLAVLYVSIFYVIFPSSWSVTWCQIFGFLDQITGIFLTGMLLINIHPSVTLILIANYEAHIELCVCKNCRKMKWITGIYVVIIFVVTIFEMIPSFVPFIVGTYGPFGGWCWIGDEENCKQSRKPSTVSLREQIFLWYMIEAINILICITIMLMAVCISAKRACRKEGKTQKAAFGKAIAQLLIILVPVGFDLVFFGLRASVTNHISVWVVLALLPPAIAFLIPLSLMIYIQFENKYRAVMAPSPDDQISVHYGPINKPKSSTSDYITARENFSSFLEINVVKKINSLV